MPDARAVTVVLLIVLSASAVGALAGYRMIIHQEWHDEAEPVTANVTVTYPDGGGFNGTVTVQGGRANALGALEALADDLGVEVGVRGTSFGAYVHTIGPHRAEGSCGWLYSVGGQGEKWQPDHAADAALLEEGDDVFWYWGCVGGA